MDGELRSANSHSQSYLFSIFRWKHCSFVYRTLRTVMSIALIDRASVLVTLSFIHLALVRKYHCTKNPRKHWHNSWGFLQHTRNLSVTIVKWYNSVPKLRSWSQFQNKPTQWFYFNELFYSFSQSASHLSLCLSLHPPVRFQYQKHFRAPTERLESRPLTGHKHVTGEIIGTCLGAFKPTWKDPVQGGGGG